MTKIKKDLLIKELKSELNYIDNLETFNEGIGDVISSIATAPYRLGQYLGGGSNNPNPPPGGNPPQPSGGNPQNTNQPQQQPSGQPADKNKGKVQARLRRIRKFMNLDTLSRNYKPDTDLAREAIENYFFSELFKQLEISGFDAFSDSKIMTDPNPAIIVKNVSGRANMKVDKTSHEIFKRRFGSDITRRAIDIFVNRAAALTGPAKLSDKKIEEIRSILETVDDFFNLRDRDYSYYENKILGTKSGSGGSQAPVGPVPYSSGNYVKPPNSSVITGTTKFILYDETQTRVNNPPETGTLYDIIQIIYEYFNEEEGKDPFDPTTSYDRSDKEVFLLFNREHIKPVSNQPIPWYDVIGPYFEDLKGARRFKRIVINENSYKKQKLLTVKNDLKEISEAIKSYNILVKSGYSDKEITNFLVERNTPEGILLEIDILGMAKGTVGSIAGGLESISDYIPDAIQKPLVRMGNEYLANALLDKLKVKEGWMRTTIKRLIMQLELKDVAGILSGELPSCEPVVKKLTMGLTETLIEEGVKSMMEKLKENEWFAQNVKSIDEMVPSLVKSFLTESVIIQISGKIYEYIKEPLVDMICKGEIPDTMEGMLGKLKDNAISKAGASKDKTPKNKSQDSGPTLVGAK